jgi:anaerobic magnesium-protoporphyrin IX monomethyl ester cyclase
MGKNKITKIVLINTTFKVEGSSFQTRITLNPPLGLLCIATSLIDAGFDVVLIDPQVENDYLNKINNEIHNSPLFVGMTTYIGENISNILSLTDYIKSLSPNLPVVWGGPLATSSPEMCFTGAPVDFIVMGMGEKTIVRLAQSLMSNENTASIPSISYKKNGKVKIGDIYSFNDNLDNWNFPSLKLWEKGIDKMRIIPILSSRGCPYNCSFCYNNSFIAKKKWYGRSAENVIKEMDSWSDYFNNNKFYFIDDNMLLNNKRACTILETAISKGYEIKQVNGNINDYKPEVCKIIFGHVEQVGFAIESASPRIQEILNKRIDINCAINFVEELTNGGIKQIATNFMFGLPSETDEDIKANIDLACKLRDINSKIRIIPYVYDPHPGDDIIPRFNLNKSIEFSLKNFSTIERAPNRNNYLSHSIRPWMTSGDIAFYLDLVLVWFFHFDPVVRSSQDIDVNNLFEKNQRLAKLFSNVPMPVL